MRQLRLRDIGGIIVIDFIDMANPKNRQLVEGALNTELARDRTKTYVVEISPLGLVEMTRQNVTDGPREILTDKCPTCEATGIVVSAETRAVEVERKLRAPHRRLEGRGLRRRAALRRRGVLIGPDGERLEELEKETGKRFAFKTKKSFRLDRFAILTEGKTAEIDGLARSAAVEGRGRQAAFPLPQARGGGRGAGRDPPRGRPRRAVARQPSPSEPAADGDQPTEKPKKKTRRGARRARAEEEDRGAPAAAANGDADAPPEPPVDGSRAEVVAQAAAEAAEPSANGDAPEAEEKPKKKTRRGTRGGRRAQEEAGRRRRQPAEPIATSEDAG